MTQVAGPLTLSDHLFLRILLLQLNLFCSEILRRMWRVSPGVSQEAGAKVFLELVLKLVYLLECWLGMAVMMMAAAGMVSLGAVQRHFA